MHDTSDHESVPSTYGAYIIFVNVAAIACAMTLAAWASLNGYVVWHHAVAPLVDLWGDVVRPTITAGLEATLVPFARAVFGWEIVLLASVQDYLTIGFLLACIAVARLRQQHAAYGMFGWESFRDTFSPGALLTYVLLILLWPVALWFMVELSSFFFRLDDGKPARMGALLLLPGLYFGMLFGVHHFLSN